MNFQNQAASWLSVVRCLFSFQLSAAFSFRIQYHANPPRSRRPCAAAEALGVAAAAAGCGTAPGALATRHRRYCSGKSSMFTIVSIAMVPAMTPKKRRFCPNRRGDCDWRASRAPGSMPRSSESACGVVHGERGQSNAIDSFLDSANERAQAGV